MSMRSNALNDVLTERIRQDDKWGEQNHDPFTYLAILTEEVGELAQAALHTRFGGNKASGLREEAVQVAAVALAIVECLDRGLWSWDVLAPDHGYCEEVLSAAQAAATLLHNLDRRGGLGLDVHADIAQVLAPLDAALAASRPARSQ